jgi:hypothetical protein
MLCLALLYWGCQKSDNSANHPPASPATKPTTTTVSVPENVATKTIATDSLITNVQQLTALLKGASATVETDGANVITPVVAYTIYEGYTKTYDCSTNLWTYVFMWSITPIGVASNLSGTGSLTVGTTTVSAPFIIVGDTVLTRPPIIGTKYYIHYTVSIPNDDNYCNNTSMTETISFSFNSEIILPGRPPIITTKSGAASNTESADPNVYQTYNDIVAGSNSNGNGTFTLDVVPGVTVCGTACHVSALGFPPTVTFYYSLEGSGTWQSYSQAGSDLNEFFIPLPQAGTYDYYTQEDTAPGVLSGQLGSGSITVQ